MKDEAKPQPVYAQFEIITDDRELQCMHVMAQALERYLYPPPGFVVDQAEAMRPARRVAAWLKARVDEI